MLPQLSFDPAEKKLMNLPPRKRGEMLSYRIQ